MSDTHRSPKALVIGLGARTPIGRSAYSAAAAVRAGISGIRAHPFMRDKAGEPFKVVLDSDLGASIRIERMRTLAISALEEVIQCLPVTRADRIPAFLALPELGGTVTAEGVRHLCRQLADHVRDRCRLQLAPIADGNAGAIVALVRAVAFVEREPGACCIVGGVDSFIDPDVLEALDAAGRVASSANRWGFPPGEGAAMLAICGPAFAREHRLQVLGGVVGTAVSHEPNRINTRTICLGVGLADAIGAAAAKSDVPITKQYCDLNGERYREHEFSYAVLRLPPSAFVNAVDYVAPADCWGHTGAATGALLMLVPVACHQRGAPPGRPLIWCGSENGRRSAAVLALPERREQ